MLQQTNETAHHKYIQYVIVCMCTSPYAWRANKFFRINNTIANDRRFLYKAYRCSPNGEPAADGSVSSQRQQNTRNPVSEKCAALKKEQDGRQNKRRNYDLSNTQEI